MPAPSALRCSGRQQRGSTAERTTTEPSQNTLPNSVRMRSIGGSICSRWQKQNSGFTTTRRLKSQPCSRRKQKPQAFPWLSSPEGRMKSKVVVTLEITVPIKHLAAFYKDMELIFGQKAMRKIMRAVKAETSYPIPQVLKRTWHTVPWIKK